MFLSGPTAVAIYSRAVASGYTTNSQWYFFFHGGVHCTQTKWYTQFNKWFCTLYIPPVLWIPLDTVLVFQRDNYYAFHSPEIEFTGRCTVPTSNTNHYFLLFIYIIHTQHKIYFKLNYYNKKLPLLL